MRKSTDSNARRNSKKPRLARSPRWSSQITNATSPAIANHKRHIARHRKTPTPHRPPSKTTNATTPAIANHKRHIARHRKSQTPHRPPSQTTNTTWPDGMRYFSSLQQPRQPMLAHQQTAAARGEVLLAGGGAHKGEPAGVLGDDGVRERPLFLAVQGAVIAVRQRVLDCG